MSINVLLGYCYLANYLGDFTSCTRL